MAICFFVICASKFAWTPLSLLYHHYLTSPRSLNMLSILRCRHCSFPYSQYDVYWLWSIGVMVRISFDIVSSSLFIIQIGVSNSFDHTLLIHEMFVCYRVLIRCMPVTICWCLDASIYFWITLLALVRGDRIRFSHIRCMHVRVTVFYMLLA